MIMEKQFPVRLCSPVWSKSKGVGVVIDVFNQAFSTNMLQSDVEQIVPVILARAGYERRRMEADPEGESLLKYLY